MMDNAIQALEAKRTDATLSIKAQRAAIAQHRASIENCERLITGLQKTADEFDRAVKALKATQGNPALIAKPDIQERLREAIGEVDAGVVTDIIHDAVINRYQATELTLSGRQLTVGDLKEGDTVEYDLASGEVVNIKPRRGRPARGQGKFDVKATP